MKPCSAIWRETAFTADRDAQTNSDSSFPFACCPFSSPSPRAHHLPLRGISSSLTQLMASDEWRLASASLHHFSSRLTPRDVVCLWKQIFAPSSHSSSRDALFLAVRGKWAEVQGRRGQGDRTKAEPIILPSWLRNISTQTTEASETQRWREACRVDKKIL